MPKNHEDLIATEIRHEGEEIVWPVEWDLLVKSLTDAMDRGMEANKLTPSSPRYLRFDLVEHQERGREIHISLVQRGKK